MLNICESYVNYLCICLNLQTMEEQSENVQRLVGTHQCDTLEECMQLLQLYEVESVSKFVYDRQDVGFPESKNCVQNTCFMCCFSFNLHMSDPNILRS